MDSGCLRKSGGFSVSMPVQYLKGVGPAKAEAFAALGVLTVGDLLEYFPRDWIFAPEPIKIGRMRVGREVTLVGLVEATDYQSFRRPPLFEALVADDTGLCRIIWFRGGYLRGKMRPGQVIVASGKLGIYKGQLQLTNPRFLLAERPDVSVQEYFSGGVYAASSKLSSAQIKRIILPVLEGLEGLVEEFYPGRFLRQAGLIGRQQAFRWIHLPPDRQKLEAAKRRLKYDELFLMQLGLALRRYRCGHFLKADALRWDKRIDKRIRRRFGFELTADQNACIEQIVRDMGKSEPMNRLLQGDVGSGKTAVGLYAALVSVANGRQVAIMAPTEVLAGQHFEKIERYLKNSRVKRLLLTGGLTGSRRREVLERIGSGEIDIVVGTVAILAEDVEFSKLGLVIIDEQHKFGVSQKAELRKGLSPHCLVMTATPIPRALAMTAFGDLDVSVIGHCPPGRGEVVTRQVASENRARAYDFIRQRLEAGRQAYFVYPRISAVEDDGQVQAATQQYQRLSEEVFPGFRVELLHGRMASAVKQRIMREFRAGRIAVLVSTVVIEVGVDVPNATVMVIDGAERFGLAQLHQLRGRIGRGRAKSYCFLFSQANGEPGRSRLEVIARTKDGFEIAEEDLRLRGPGELFSTRQHGLPDLRIANIVEDYELLVLARRKAFELVWADPMLQRAEHLALRRALVAKFGDSLGLADVA